MFFFLDLHVSLDIPNAYSINSITGTNWEGVGVLPDFKVPFEDSFDFGYLNALENLRAKTEDEKKRNKLDWAIAGLKSGNSPIRIDSITLQKYAGDYGERSIIYKDGYLYYERNDKSTFKLIPMTETLFAFRDWDDARIEFVNDNSGHVLEFHTLSPDGGKSAHKRNSD